MSEPDAELGTTEESVDWAAALAEAVASEDEATPQKVEQETDAQDLVAGDASTETPIGDSQELKTGTSESEESKDALQPLESWSDEVKTHFRSLDTKGQQFLLDRHKEFEGDYTRKTQDVADIRKRYERLDAVLKPYDEVAKTRGIDIAPHVAAALQSYVAFNSDPLSVIRGLIQARQITAEQLGFGEKDDQTDPATRALRNELDQTKRVVANLQQGTIQSNTQQLVSIVNAFKEAKDEHGNLKHPHFDRVRHLMAPIVDSGKSLDDAYGEVVWTVPEHRQATDKAAREKAEAEASEARGKADKEAKAKAEKDRLEKLKKAKSAETLPASDTDKGKGKPNEFKGWNAALQEELSQLVQ